MGLSFKGRTNFQSIPGLKGYWDGRFGVSVNTSDEVLSLLDLSSEETTITPPKALNRPILIDNKWIEYRSSDGEFRTLSSQRRDYRFLHNGSPFGIYGIINFEFVSNTRFIQFTPNGESTGMFLRFAATESNGRFHLQVQNNNTIVRNVIISNLLNTGNTNYRIFPNTYSFSQLFYGANKSNNQILRFDSDTITTVSFDSSTIDEYSQDNHTAFNIGRNNNNSSFKIGIVLIYDFTGFNDIEIATYDLKIRELLEKELLHFK